MPCCYPRYGPLIVAGIDFLAGVIGLFIVLILGRDSPLILVCLTFPTCILVLLGLILPVSFIKKNFHLATIAFGLNITLIAGCLVIVLILLIRPEFKSYKYSPVIIAALLYGVVLQSHFSWVLYDFRTKRLSFRRSFHYLDDQNGNV